MRTRTMRTGVFAGSGGRHPVRGCLALVALCALVQWTPVSAWEHFPLPIEPGFGGIVIGDFDGDGANEALLVGTMPMPPWGQGYGLAVLSLLDGKNGPPRVRSSLALEMVIAQDGLVLAKGVDGRDRAVGPATLPDGSAMIAIFGGAPLRLERLLASPPGYRVQRVFAVTDLDGDGEPEIVAGLSVSSSSWSYPAILDGSTGAVRWLGDTLASTVAVAQLDADPALELVISGTPGLVIDGATHTVDWSWAGGFGDQLVGGRFGAGGAGGFVSIPSEFPAYMQIFGGRPFAPLLEIQNGGPINYVVASPAAEGRVSEIASQSSHSTRFFNPLTGVSTREFPGGASGPFAVGNILAGEGVQLLRRAVAYPDVCPYADGSANRGSEYDNHFNFSVTDLGDDSCYRWVGKLGSHAAVVRGPLEGPGSDQIASFSHNNVLTIHDAASGAPLRFRGGILSMNSPPRMDRATMALVAHASGTPTLVVASEQDGPTALDAITLQQRWTRYVPNGRVAALSAIDIGNNGTEEVVLAVGSGQLVVLDGASGTILGESPPAPVAFPPDLVTFHDDQGRARALMTTDDGLHLDLFDLASFARVARTQVAKNPITTLWRWGQGNDCRVAVLDDAAVISVRDCSSLVEVNHRQAPTGTVFVREAGANGSALIVAAGEYLYRLDSDSVATPISSALGSGLGLHNAGDVRRLPSGDRWDATMGSNTLVTRRTLAPDLLFGNGFD